MATLVFNKMRANIHVIHIGQKFTYFCLLSLVDLLGVSLRPLCLILRLAPLGALHERLRDYRRAGSKLHVLTIQKVLMQVYGWNTVVTLAVSKLYLLAILLFSI